MIFSSLPFLFIVNTPFIFGITTRQVSFILVIFYFLFFIRHIRAYVPAVIFTLSLALYFLVMGIEGINRQVVVLWASLLFGLCYILVSRYHSVNFDALFRGGVLSFLVVNFCLFYNFSLYEVFTSGFRARSVESGFGLNYFFNSYLIFPFLFYSFFLNSYNKKLSLALFLVSSILIVLSFSRQNIVALFFAISLISLFRLGFLVSLFFGFITTMMLYFFLDNPLILSLLSRFGKLQKNIEGSRLQQFEHSLDLFQENPLMGVGLGQFGKHSTHLVHSAPEAAINQLISELGLYGIIFIVYSLGVILLAVKLSCGILRDILLLGIFSLFVLIFSNEVFWDPIYLSYFFLAFSIVYRRNIRNS